MCHLIQFTFYVFSFLRSVGLVVVRGLEVIYYQETVSHFLVVFIRCLLRCDFPFPRILVFFLPTAKNVLNIPRPKTSVGFVLSLNFIISYASFSPFTYVLSAAAALSTSFANSIKNGLNNHHRLGLANCFPSFTNTKLFMFIQLLILCCVTKIFTTTSILEWPLP